MGKNFAKNKIDMKLVSLGCGLMLVCSLVLIGLALGWGERPDDPRLTLTPLELSEDAKMLARALGFERDEAQLFEYRLEGAEADRSQSLALEVWLFTEGRWQKQVGAALEVGQESRVLLVNSGEGFWVIDDGLMERGSGYYCATAVWRQKGSRSWWSSLQREAVTLAPGEEAWLRAQEPLAEQGDTVTTPAYSQESFRQDLAVEGCVVLTAAFNPGEQGWPAAGGK